MIKRLLSYFGSDHPLVSRAKSYSSPVVRRAFYILLTNGSTAVLTFVTTSLLSYFLVPDEFGVLSMFNLLALLAMPIVNISSNSAAYRQYFNPTINKARYMGTAFVVPAANTFLVGSFVWIFQDFLVEQFSIPAFWILLSIPYALMQGYVNLVFNVFLASDNIKYYALIRIGNSVTSILLTLGAFYLYKGDMVDARLGADFAAWTMFALTSIQLFHKEGLLSLKLKWEYAKHLLSFGLPLMPTILISSLNFLVGRYFLNEYLGLAEAGFFMMAYQFSVILNLVTDAISKSWTVKLFERLAANDKKHYGVIVKNMYQFIGISFALAAVVAYVFTPIFFYFFINKSYAPVLDMVPLICFGMALQAISRLFASFISFLEKNIWLLFPSAISFMVNFLVCYFFIEELGSMAVTIALFAAMLSYLLLIIPIVTRYFKMPWFNFYNS